MDFELYIAIKELSIFLQIPVFISLYPILNYEHLDSFSLTKLQERHLSSIPKSHVNSYDNIFYYCHHK